MQCARACVLKCKWFAADARFATADRGMRGAGETEEEGEGESTEWQILLCNWFSRVHVFANHFGCVSRPYVCECAPDPFDWWSAN